jgi:hypothetical protein
MANILFNRKHLKEYALYGSIAGAFHGLTVWFFLRQPHYHTSPVLFIGSFFFMFSIMAYSIRLTRRRPEYKSTWTMLIAGHMAVVTGILVSATGSFILCWIYIPGLMSGQSSEDFLHSAPGGLNVNNIGTLELIFITATFENFVAGAFISAMIAYALKPNQTRDQTPKIFEEPAEPGVL